MIVGEVGGKTSLFGPFDTWCDEIAELFCAASLGQGTMKKVGVRKGMWECLQERCTKDPSEEKKMLSWKGPRESFC